jgi:hypothetical protein
MTGEFTMGSEIAGVVHYGGDGAGHAMRMLAVAEKLEEKDFRVKITGGGPGQKFLRINGRSNFSPTNIHFEKNLHERNIVYAMLKLPLPAFKRVKDIMEWIEGEDIDFLVLDDPIAAIAAFLKRKDFYFLSHWTWRLPESWIDKVGTFFFHRSISAACEGFFCPAIWGDSPPGAEKVGPIAPDDEGDVEEFDVLVVPSGMKNNIGGIAGELMDAGYDVKEVGSEEWNPKPSLQPFIEEADYVVCSGYSTIMEAAVAGTPCIINPCTSEQRGVAERLKKYSGFRNYSGDIEYDLEEVEGMGGFSNGAEEVADIVSDSRLE